MSQCSASELIAEACQNGFTCRSEPELLALLNQLLCNYSTSFEESVLLNSITTLPHGFDSTPRFVRAVVVNVANDAGSGTVTGDETSVESIFSNADSCPAFGITANSTNIIISNEIFAPGDEASV